MKCDQIAFYCDTPEQEKEFKALFGLQDAEWIKDTVIANSSVFGGRIQQNVAQLQFNYDLGIELEILRYVNGPSWHQSRPKDTPFISHIGLHLGDNEDFPKMKNCALVQETWTLQHTSPYLVTGAGAGRRYHYRIFQVGPTDFVKYIKRIHPLVHEP